MRGTHTTEKYIPSMKKFRNDISKFKSSKGLLQEGTCYEKTICLNDDSSKRLLSVEMFQKNVFSAEGGFLNALKRKVLIRNFL